MKLKEGYLNQDTAGIFVSEILLSRIYPVLLCNSVCALVDLSKSNGPVASILRRTRAGGHYQSISY